MITAVAYFKRFATNVHYPICYCFLARNSRDGLTSHSPNFLDNFMFEFTFRHRLFQAGIFFSLFHRAMSGTSMPPYFTPAIYKRGAAYAVFAAKLGHRDPILGLLQIPKSGCQKIWTLSCKISVRVSIGNSTHKRYFFLGGLPCKVVTCIISLIINIVIPFFSTGNALCYYSSPSIIENFVHTVCCGEIFE